MASSVEDAAWTVEHGRALRDRRHRQGFSQEALAEAAGIDRRTLSGLEQGKRQPRYGTIRAVAEALGCESEDLLQPVPEGPTAAQLRWRQAIARRGSAGPAVEAAEQEPPPIPFAAATSGAAPSAELAAEQEGRTSNAPARRRSWLGFAVLAVVALAVGVWITIQQRSGTTELDPNLLAIAVFENATGDASLDHLGRQASEWIAAQISEFGLAPTRATRTVIAGRGANQVVRTGTPGGTTRKERRLEIAESTGAGVVIWGAYDLGSNALEIVSEVHDVLNDRLIHTVPQVSGSPEAPMRAIEAMGEKVLGAVAAHFDVEIPSPRVVPPPAFAAYREFRAAVAVSKPTEARGWYSLPLEEAADAIRHLERASQLDSTFFTPRFALFDLYLYVLRDFARADSCLTLISRNLDQLTPYEALKSRVWAFKLEHDVPGALGILREMREMDPTDQVIRFWTGAAARYANRPREAVAMLGGMGPAFWRTRMGTSCLWQLCCAHHMLGEHDRELEVSRSYLRIRPDGTFPTFARVRPLAALGRVEDVRHEVDRYLRSPKQEPSEVRVVFSVAVGELRWHGHLEEASRLALRAADYYSHRSPDEVATETNRRNLAMCLYLAERWEEARAVFEQLAAESPGDVTCKGYLGALAARRGDGEEAMRLFDELHRDGAFHACASIAALLGERKRAVDLLRETLEHGTDPNWMHADMDFESLRGFPPFEELTRPKG